MTPMESLELIRYLLAKAIKAQSAGNDQLAADCWHDAGIAVKDMVANAPVAEKKKFTEAKNTIDYDTTSGRMPFSEVPRHALDFWSGFEDGYDNSTMDTDESPAYEEGFRAGGRY